MAYALLLLASSAAAESIRLSGALSGDDAGCLSDLLRDHYDYLANHATQITELSRSAKVGHAILSNRKRPAYIFLFDNIGWCGSAGCMLIVGERRAGKRCHLLYDSDGIEGAIVVSKQRDRGYRRLFTPCEARFHGKEYQQVNEECPTIDIQREQSRSPSRDAGRLEPGVARVLDMGFEGVIHTPSGRANLNRKNLRIETRLRSFAGQSYE